MTHDQVQDFADQCQLLYAHGALLIHLGANIGTRSAELRILTADPTTQQALLGNFVDIKEWEVRVRFQIDGSHTQSSKMPKGSKVRDFVVPDAQHIATGIDLRQLLADR
jgi:hypothetical protein